MKLRYCTGHGRSNPHCWRTRARSSGRAPGSASSKAGSPVRRTMLKMVMLRMNSVTMLYRTRNTINCRILMPLSHRDASPSLPMPLFIPQLDVFPGIGIAGGDRREDILPALRRNARPDGIHERMAEDGNKIGVFQNAPLDLLGQLFA